MMTECVIDAPVLARKEPDKRGEKLWTKSKMPCIQDRWWKLAWSLGVVEVDFLKLASAGNPCCICFPHACGSNTLHSYDWFWISPGGNGSKMKQLCSSLFCWDNSLAHKWRSHHVSLQEINRCLWKSEGPILCSNHNGIIDRWFRAMLWGGHQKKDSQSIWNPTCFPFSWGEKGKAATKFSFQIIISSTIGCVHGGYVDGWTFWSGTWWSQERETKQRSLHWPVTAKTTSSARSLFEYGQSLSSFTITRNTVKLGNLEHFQFHTWNE